MYQERLVSTRTKKIIEHSPTGAYLLNTHALHNYRRILSVLSPDLRKQLTAATVTNHDGLRLHAATLLRVAKVTEGEPTPTGSAVDASEQPAPAFVKATVNRNRKAARTTKAKGKGKGKIPEITPDNAAASTSANHTTAVATSNPGATSALPIPASRVPAASSNATSGALPLPASSIQSSGKLHHFKRCTLKPILFQCIQLQLPTIIATAPHTLRLYSLPTLWFHLPPTHRHQVTMQIFIPTSPHLYTCFLVKEVITRLGPLACTNPFIHQLQASPPLHNLKAMSLSSLRIINGGVCHNNSEFTSDVATLSIYKTCSYRLCFRMFSQCTQDAFSDRLGIIGL